MDAWDRSIISCPPFQPACIEKQGWTCWHEADCSTMNVLWALFDSASHYTSFIVHLTYHKTTKEEAQFSQAWHNAPCHNSTMELLLHIYKTSLAFQPWHFTRRRPLIVLVFITRGGFFGFVFWFNQLSFPTAVMMRPYPFPFVTLISRGEVPVQ